jgi:hypothetical protein
MIIFLKGQTDFESITFSRHISLVLDPTARECDDRIRFKNEKKATIIIWLICDHAGVLGISNRILIPKALFMMAKTGISCTLIVALIRIIYTLHAKIRRKNLA